MNVFSGTLNAVTPDCCLQVSKGISVNIIAFIPAALLGIIGGILGAIFTFINLKIARARKRLLAKVPNRRQQQIIRMAEPIIIMVSFIMTI